jgi:hypothetical protein
MGKPTGFPVVAQALLPAARTLLSARELNLNG